MDENTNIEESATRLPRPRTAGMIAIALAAFIRFGPQLMLGNIEPSDPFYPLTQKIVALTSTSEVTFVLAAVVLGGLYAIFIYAPKHQTD